MDARAAVQRQRQTIRGAQRRHGGPLPSVLWLLPALLLSSLVLTVTEGTPNRYFPISASSADAGPTVGAGGGDGSSGSYTPPPDCPEGETCAGSADAADPDSPGPATSCPTGKRLCGNGACVKIGMMCALSLQCTANQFRCRDSSGCVPDAAVCDGQEDCNDGSDEEQGDKCELISGCLSQGLAACPADTQCIATRKFCDGTPDCSSGSDEGADFCTSYRCPRGSFKCPSSPLVCRPGAMCNGINDCPVTDSKVAYTEDEDPETCSSFAKPIDPNTGLPSKGGVSTTQLSEGSLTDKGSKGKGAAKGGGKGSSTGGNKGSSKSGGKGSGGKGSGKGTGNGGKAGSGDKGKGNKGGAASDVKKQADKAKAAAVKVKQKMNSKGVVIPKRGN